PIPSWHEGDGGTADPGSAGSGVARREVRKLHATIRDVRGTAITLEFDGQTETWYHHRPWTIPSALVEAQTLAVIPDCVWILSASPGGPRLYRTRTPLGVCRATNQRRH
ncbi:MAG: hypothetical protein LH630_10180, partial [Actinomycetia bacterium]|nr:hypothetical protein [Actinomycetes bacterium]